MARPLSYLLITFLLLLAISSFASNHDPDSLLNRHDSILINFFNHSTDSLAAGNIHYIYSARLSGFQRYDPLYAGDRFCATLGNVGLAYRNLFFRPEMNDGFSFGMNAFDFYTFRPENTRYYQTNLPVTYLYYANGAKKEQLFRVIHSQTIAKIITLGVDLFVINAPGRYNRQKSDDKSFVATGQYYTKNKRYGVIANYILNKFIVYENGGIMNDTIFEQNLETDRRVIDVNLMTAQNLVKESGVFVNQYFYLSRDKSVPDSLNQKRNVFHAGRIAYTFNYRKQIQVYSDEEPRASFYMPYDTIIDTIQTYDSVWSDRFENTFSWSNMRLNEIASEKIIYLNLSLKHQIARMTPDSVRLSFIQLIPFAELIIRPIKGMKISFNGNYTIGDFNNNGYQMIGGIAYDFHFKGKDFGTLSLETSQTLQVPGYFYQKYTSNYFRWTNDFRQQLFQFAGLRFDYKGLAAGVNYHIIKDFVYLNNEARPEQADGSINIISAFLIKDFRWRVWNLDVNLLYQHVSDQDIVRLPDFLAKVSCYPTFSLFKNAAILQPGIDLFYNTSYYADDWMPATRHFYLQNEKEVGNYIYMDLFVNIMIKRFRFFIEYHHLNSLWSENRYYMPPHYPMQDGALKFGIAWAFYD